MHQAVGTGGLDTRLIGSWVRQLRALQPDMVHVRGLQNEGFQAILAARLAGCQRVLVTVHGTVRDLVYANRSIRRSILIHFSEPATLRLASHVAAVCRHGADRRYIQRHTRFPVAVIPNGVVIPSEDFNRGRIVRQSLGVPKSAIVLIAVSRLTWEKGYQTLCDAAAAITPRPDRPVLLIVGDGPDEAEIKKAFISGNGGLEVRFLGRRSDVSDLLAASDIFVFPTLHENLSNALLEAMAHRLPVVASAVGGNREVLAAGGGVLVPAGDAASLSKAIDDLLFNASVRHRLGEMAYDIVRSKYSLDVMLDALDNAYDAVISGVPLEAEASE
jgi:glycosyltransferase involved in cell wall biosynthesis